jgi:flavin-dependent dehydrogenase
MPNSGDRATVDAVAAGGGLAGAAFALELARRGRRVTVVERTAGSHHKVCGEFLSDRAQALLGYLGVDVGLLAGSAIGTLSLSNRARQAAAPLPFRAVGVSRLLLDETLLKAAEDAGAEVWRATTVEGLDGDARGVRVRTTRGTIQCEAAALACGKHNVRGLQRPSGTMVGFKMHFMPSAAARAALTGTVHLIAFPGGYLGLCLIEGGVLSMAWIIDADVLNTVGAGWAAQSAYFAAQSRFFAEYLDGAKPVWEKPLAVSGLPYGYMRSAMIAPSIYPVGDQLAVIPSFAGDGTALALASGIAAAQAVLRGEDAGRYQARMIAGYKPQFRRAAALDMVISNAMLRWVGIAGARLVPHTVTMLVAATRLGGVDALIASREMRI